MKKYLLFIIVALTLSTAALAQKPRKVEGSFTYYANEADSRADAKRKALEAARINALAREFGTVVSQDIVQQETVSTEGEGVYFDALSNTKVKGEWIEDIGQPEYSYDMADGLLIVTCRVKGMARELSNDTVEFDAWVMRNGSDRRYAATEFRTNDLMTVGLRTPVDGYVAIFLIDGETVYTLLPYRSNTSGQVKVKRNTEYVFFDPKTAPSGSDEPDEMILLTDKEVERDVLRIVFSPNPFTRPNDSGDSELVPRSLSRQDFTRWLTSRQNNDKRLSIQDFNLVIKK